MHLSISSPIAGQTMQEPERTESSQTPPSAKASNSIALIPYTANQVLKTPTTALPLSSLTSGILHTTFSFVPIEEMISSMSRVNKLFRQLFKPLEASLPVPIRTQLPSRNLTPRLMNSLAKALDVPLSVIGSHGRKFSSQGCFNIQKYIEACSHLEAVKLTPKIGYMRNDMAKEDIQFVIARCPNLTKFESSDCPALDDDILDMFTKQLPHLNSLSIPGCNYVSDKGLTPLFRSRAMKCVNLYYYDGLPYDALLALASNASQLEVFKFFTSKIIHGFNTSVTNPAQFKEQYNQALQTLFAQKTQLKEVDLTEHGLNEGQLLQRKTVITLINHAPNLRKLCLNNASISDSIIQHLVKKCPLLEELVIEECKNLTKSSLKSLRRCKSLRILHIRGNNKMMTSSAIKTLQQANPRLKIIRTYQESIDHSKSVKSEY